MAGRALKQTAKHRRRRTRDRHRRLLEFEQDLWTAGAGFVAGVDEAGAGPLAGPVMAGCVVLDPERTKDLIGVDDSKKLSEKKREEMADVIRASVMAFSVREATVEEIDTINIRQACMLAMHRAFMDVVRQLEAVDHLLIDARTLPELDVPQTSIIKGDAKSLSIAAASILAKVERDRLMTEAALRYPEYGFERHKGYGTREHQNALKKHGATDVHRRSFAPVRRALGLEEPTEQLPLL